MFFLIADDQARTKSTRIKLEKLLSSAEQDKDVVGTVMCTDIGGRDKLWEAPPPQSASHIADNKIDEDIKPPAGYSTRKSLDVADNFNDYDQQVC